MSAERAIQESVEFAVVDIDAEVFAVALDIECGTEERVAVNEEGWGADDAAPDALGVVGVDRAAGGRRVGDAEAVPGGDLREHFRSTNRLTPFEQRVTNREVETFTDLGSVLVRERGGTEDRDGGRRERRRVEAGEQVGGHQIGRASCRERVSVLV